MTLRDIFKKIFPEKTAAELEVIPDVEFPGETQTQKEKTQTPPAGDSKKEDNVMFQTLVAENKKLFAELAEINKREKEREELLSNKAKQEKENLIKQILEKGIKEQKIPAKNEAVYKNLEALLKADFEAAKIMIEALPVVGETSTKPPEKPAGNNGNGNGNADSLNKSNVIDVLRAKAISELESK